MKIFRYAGVGAIAAIVDFLIFAVFAKVLNFNYLAVGAVGFIIATTINYFLSVRFVFESGVRFSFKKEILLVFLISFIGLGINQADIVYGSRFKGNRPHRVLYFWHRMGNGLLTFMSNMFTNLNLTDMETGYKAFRREVIQSIKIEEDRFGFEPEITAKIARGQFRIYEVGIGYFGRTYDEGKKIGWKDGMWAIWCILKYNLRR
jgi:hypothetical protein